MGRGSAAICALLVLLSASVEAQDKASPDYRKGKWHLEEGPGRRLVAELEGVVKAPQIRASEWILYAARAPKHRLSEAQRQFMWCEAPGDKRPGKVVREEGGREVFLYRGAKLPAELKEVKFRVRYELTTSALVLKPGKGKGKVRSPSRKVLAACLESEGTSAYDQPEFIGWLKKQDLVRERRERDLAFAWRVLKAIASGFSYAYPPQSEERLCHQVVADKASDCGGLSSLAVAVLRANKVPARLLVGRWVELDKKGQDQHHVKFEFFAKGIGWVPCDGSGAVEWEQGAARAFGREDGNFLVLHTGNDLSLDTFHWGRQKVRWLQGVAWWVSGAGKTDGASVDATWTVAPAK